MTSKIPNFSMNQSNDPRTAHLLGSKGGKFDWSQYKKFIDIMDFDIDIKLLLKNFVWHFFYIFLVGAFKEFIKSLRFSDFT